MFEVFFRLSNEFGNFWKKRHSWQLTYISDQFAYQINTPIAALAGEQCDKLNIMWA